MDDPTRQPDRPHGGESSITGSGAFLGPGHGTPMSSPPPTDAESRSPRPRRRWPWILLTVVLLGAASAAAWVAIDQRDTALLWRERAAALEEQRDEAIGRGDVLDGQVAHLTEVLEVSEDDVAALEERIRQLADEKAQAEDAATTVEVERDVVAELTADIAAAAGSLDACVDRLFDLQAASVAAFNQTAAGEEVDIGPLNEQARDTTQFCNDARSAAARASAAARQLTSP